MVGLQIHKKMMKITIEQARQIMLQAQGLLEPSQKPAVKDDLLATIIRIGALQIDTIHAVARSAYFTLWSRLGAYDCAWLDELLAEGALFEYWAHAACLLPSEKYPLFRRIQLEGFSDWRDPANWLQINAGMVNKILERIRVEGALKSSDFENPRSESGGWWNWKAEKQALEHLFTNGVLMVARREKFQRVYDLRERVRPGWDDQNTPSIEEVHRQLTLKTVRALGIATARWVPDYFRLTKRGNEERLAALVNEKELIEVEIDSWKDPAYLHPEHLPTLERALYGDLQPTLSTLLSPFDPLIWHRERAKQLFGFDYALECYLPASNRRFGYFSLPFLYRGNLIARLDTKVNRSEGNFEVKGLFLEGGVAIQDDWILELAQVLNRCAEWHEASQATIQRSEPVELATKLNRLLSKAKL